jgi:hypothetical protein
MKAAVASLRPSSRAWRPDHASTWEPTASLAVWAAYTAGDHQEPATAIAATSRSKAAIIKRCRALRRRGVGESFMTTTLPNGRQAFPAGEAADQGRA